MPIRNAAPSPEPEVGDIIEIEYSGDILESYPAQIANVYGIKVVEETHNNESLNDQIVEQENRDDMIGLLGDWILDATYTENVNAGLSLQEMFGTVLGEFGTTLHLNADGTIEYSIGALTGKSTWHNDVDTGRYISELVVYPDEREETLIFYEFRESPESQEYLVLEYNGYSLFWIRTSETIE